MKEQYKNLAQTISDRTFFDVDEVATMIKIHFELWQSQFSNLDLFNCDIARKRNALVHKFRSIELEKNIVEKQLLIGKSKLKEGKEVDTEWLARANLAFRIKKAQMRAIQEDLSTLRAIQKDKNIRNADTETRRIKHKIVELLRIRLGEDKAMEILQEAVQMVKDNL